MVDFLDTPLTNAEILELRRLVPDATRIDDQGYIIPLKTRRELAHLERAYPTMDMRRPENQPPGRVATDSPEEALLRVRYPSCYPKVK